MKRILFSTLALLVAASACKKKDDSTPAAPQATIRLVSSATLGSYLTDGEGRSLYYYTRDVSGSNSCQSVRCMAAWPIFYTDDIVVGSDLNKSDFTTGKTAGDLNQIYYKGWPLYYYAQSVNGQYMQEKAGETSGEKVGGVWYVVRPNYTVMVANNTITDKATQQTSGKSYLIDAQGRTLYTFSKDASAPTTQTTTYYPDY